MSQPALEKKPTSRPAPPTVRANLSRPASASVAPVAQPASDADVWRKLFQEWPESIPRRGIVVNSQGEPLPFKGYMLKGEMLLLQRPNPDSLGARFLLMPFSEVALVKLTDPLGQEAFNAAGYEGTLD